MKKRFSRWDGWKETAGAAGEACSVRSSGGSLLIRLSKVAAERKVKEVVFRPLLVDGCLGIRKDGFVIFVKCAKQKCSELSKALELEDQARTSLPYRVRFTIAHEIAHTFFFNLQSSPPSSDVELDNWRTVNSLEYACNELARRLLLPANLFRPALEKADVLDPDALRKIARRAAVSTDVFTIRLAQVFDWSANIGAVLCVRQEHTGPHVLSKAMHYSLRPHLERLERNTPLTSLIKAKSFVLNGGDQHEVPVDVPCLVGDRRAVQRVVVRCEHAAPTVGSTFLVTVRREGDLQLVSSV
jgi:hypothetical protein